MPLKVNDENKFTLIKHSNSLKQVGKIWFWHYDAKEVFKLCNVHIEHKQCGQLD